MCAPYVFSLIFSHVINFLSSESFQAPNTFSYREIIWVFRCGVVNDSEDSSSETSVTIYQSTQSNIDDRYPLDATIYLLL